MASNQHIKDDWAVPDLSWFNKEIPPLPEPQGEILRVYDTDQLMDAVSRAKAGTTIMLEEGTYQLKDTVILKHDRLTLRGASNDRSKVVLLGNGFHGNSSVGPGEAISIKDGQNITVANLTIKECRVHGISVQGTTHCQGVHIYNVGFIDIGERGVKVNTSTSDEYPHSESGIVEYCWFEQTQQVDPNRQDGFGGNYISGIAALGVKDWIIRDNVFINVRGATDRGEAILVWVSCVGTIVERNIVFGCNRGICIGNWHGAEKENYWHHKGGIVRNNFVYTPDRFEGSSGIEIVKVKGLKVFNNTVFHDNPNASRAFEYLHPETSVEIKNNLVRGLIRSREGGKADLERNLTQVQADWFIDPENGDLRLTEKAAEALGAGVMLPEVRDDFFGTPRSGFYDIGAHQITK